MNNMSTILYCNPSQNNQLQLWFGDGASNTPVEHIVESTQADTLLQSIVNSINNQPIDHIVVVNQARSFTFVRIVVTICNTLHYATGASLHSLEEPVGQWSDLQSVIGSDSHYIIPHYSQPPNIS